MTHVYVVAITTPLNKDFCLFIWPNRDLDLRLIFRERCSELFGIPKFAETAEILSIVLDRMEEMDDHMKNCSMVISILKFGRLNYSLAALVKQDM